MLACRNKKTIPNVLADFCFVEGVDFVILLAKFGEQDYKKQPLVMLVLYKALLQSGAFSLLTGCTIRRYIIYICVTVNQYAQRYS